jgi:Ca2+/Na+ antiporter
MVVLLDLLWFLLSGRVPVWVFTLFYSLCSLWLWYFKNHQMNSFTKTIQYVQRNGLKQGRKFVDHLSHCQIFKEESTDWIAIETCFRNNIQSNAVSESC